MATIAELIGTQSVDPLLDYIKRNEGFGKPGKPGRIYKDSRGYNTVGYGFNIDDPSIRASIPSDVVAGRRPITETEATPLLQKFVDVAKRDAQSLVGVDTFKKLNGDQQIALVDFVYNLGLPKAKGFKNTVAAIQSGDFNRAAMEMLDSPYASQVGDRAIRNSKLLSGASVAEKKPEPTFKDAFGAARKAGKKVFTYNGKQYSTEVKNG